MKTGRSMIGTNTARRVMIAIDGLRYASRSLARSRGFFIGVVLTLALGFGAATAMFAVVNGVLLRPLPYPQQDRLVEIAHRLPRLGVESSGASPAIYFTYRDHGESFEAIGLWDWSASPVTVQSGGEPESVQSVEITHEIFDVLGVAPALGRTFDAADDSPGGPPTVIVSHSYGQRRFGGDSPLGQTLVVDGIAREIVGVLPQGFEFFAYPADVFYPLQPDRGAAMFASFDGRAVARLKPGVTLAQANADVARMIPIVAREFPARGAQRFTATDLEPKLQLLRDRVVGTLGPTLWILMSTIGILLLIGCANVANLLLVRTQSRLRQLGIRAALGAGRGRIAGHVLAECAILTLSGTALGLAAAYAALPLIERLAFANLPQIATVRIDTTVALVALAASALTCALLVPLSLARVRYSKLTRLAQSTTRATEGREAARAMRALLVAQVALAFVLLVGAGLMLRTFQALRDVDPGFSGANAVQIAEISVSERDKTAEEIVREQQAILDAVAAVPGVASVGFTVGDGLPLDGDGRSASIAVEGERSGEGPAPLREIQFVSPGYFETIGTRLVAGRAFTWDDVYGGRPVTLVSESLAAAEWGSAAAALGKRIRPPQTDSPWFDVIGVTANVHYDGVDRPAPPSVTFPPVTAQRVNGVGTMSLVVRSPRVGTPGFLPELRSAVWRANPSVALANTQTFEALLAKSLARTSTAMTLLAITSGMALLLGVVGIYGVLSYAVAARKHEIGIRTALGAQRGRVRMLFVREALALTGIGLLAGLGAASALARLLASQLFEIGPFDAATYLAVAGLLTIAASTAAYIPARRASAVDPMTVLRAE
jgi:predicted permease